MEIKRPKIQLLIFIAVYLSAITVALRLISMNNVFEIKKHLKTLIPIFLEINFLLIIIGLIINFGIFKKIFTQLLSKKKIFWLLTICLIGVLFSAFFPKRTHRIYYDEDIYLHIAQNLNYERKAQMCNYGTNEYGEFKCFQGEYNKEPYGYPYIVSLMFRIFGCNEIAAHILNNIIYGFSILVIFLIVFTLFESVTTAFYSSLIFLLIPQNLIWSNTASVELSASFFTGFALFILFLYLKERKTTLLFLTFVILPFSVQFRPESILVLFLVFFSILFIGFNALKMPVFYGMGGMLFLALIPHLFHLYAVRGEPWGSIEAKFGLKYIAYNLKTNVFFYLDNHEFPLLFTILAILGLLTAIGWKKKIIVSMWFLLFWGIFIPFYAGSYQYGADVRFSLVSYMPLAIFSGLGIEWTLKKLKKGSNNKWSQFIPIVIVGFTFLSFLPFIQSTGEEAWGARADHLYAKKFSELLPKNSLILTHNPNMFLLWGKSAAQTSLVFNNPAFVENVFERFGGGIYFHYNFWCNVNDPHQNQFCQNILDRFETQLIKEYHERNYRFALYKVFIQDTKSRNNE